MSRCPYASEWTASWSRWRLSSTHDRHTFDSSRVVRRWFFERKARNLQDVMLQRFSTCRYCLWRTCFFTYVRGTTLAFMKDRVPSSVASEYIFDRRPQNSVGGTSAVSDLNLPNARRFDSENSGWSRSKFDVSSRSDMERGSTRGPRIRCGIWSCRCPWSRDVTCRRISAADIRSKIHTSRASRFTESCSQRRSASRAQSWSSHFRPVPDLRLWSATACSLPFQRLGRVWRGHRSDEHSTSFERS